jgi:purine nucleoside phosphorylase
MLANAAAGLNQQQLDHQDVLAQAAQASRPLQQLLLAHFNSTQGAANS